MSADIKIFTDDIESQALDQCYTIAKSPVFATARIERTLKPVYNFKAH